MWFSLALLSAFFHALLWVLARVSRGMPSSVVAALQFTYGPVLLFFTAPTVEFPWGEGWWRWYLLLPFFTLPMTMWALTYALHHTEVTVVKPLFGLSSVVTLAVASLFFGERASLLGMAGIFSVTIGLFCLYHGRWAVWRGAGPWIVLGGTVVMGINAAVLGTVIARFPHVLAISALVTTASFVLNGIPAAPNLQRTHWTLHGVLILLGMAAAGFLQDIAVLQALLLGPSSYVIAIKRTSVLFTAVIGYVVLHERNQSLLQLAVSSVLVAAGAGMLAIG